MRSKHKLIIGGGVVTLLLIWLVLAVSTPFRNLANLRVELIANDLVPQ